MAVALIATDSGKKRSFGNRYLRRSIARQQKEHPREKNHGVAIRKLPPAWISMAPKHERHNPNRNPRYRPVPSACSKKEEKERTAEKDGASKGRKAKEGKIRVISKPFKQHFVDVPGNGVKRKQPVFVPRFVPYFRDVKVTEIKNRMEPREIIRSSQQRQSHWQS